MGNEERSSVINFQKLKEEKQYEIEKSFFQLYESLFSYIEEEANIREKVRAKQLFSHHLNLSNHDIYDKTVAGHFEHWFAFDYVTVIGSRMIDLFIRKKYEDFTKPMLDLSGFMLLSYLEPIHILDKNEKKVKFNRLFEQSTVEGETFLFSHQFNPGDLAFVRTMNIGFKVMIIGPSFIINKSMEKEIKNHIEKVYKQGKDQMRKYLKEHGIDYLKDSMGKE
ncbi:hypothetical protein QA612_05995 [Evansella sp. AB-P1]|uniref:hypothetical protein n=1 Tax=Evansella sp. AB-P1 TaxID=3037653 RepID=UPI00241FEC26|nr:hypothetical protein [Evansella sp. AB-P1]MDG5787038.1 hypothetical protein [Evansella sp. AB-P1]